MHLRTGTFFLGLATAMAAACSPGHDLDSANYCAGYHAPFASQYDWLIRGSEATVTGLAAGTSIQWSLLDGDSPLITDDGELVAAWIRDISLRFRYVTIDGAGRADLENEKAFFFTKRWQKLSDLYVTISPSSDSPIPSSNVLLCRLHLDAQAIVDPDGPAAHGEPFDVGVECLNDDEVGYGLEALRLAVGARPRADANVYVSTDWGELDDGGGECGARDPEAHMWTIEVDDGGLEGDVHIAATAGEHESSTGTLRDQFLFDDFRFWQGTPGVDFEDLATLQIVARESRTLGTPLECPLDAISQDEILASVAASTPIVLDAGHCELAEGTVALTFLPALKEPAEDVWPAIADGWGGE